MTGAVDPAPARDLSRLIAGYQVSQAIHVAATLGIADLLAEGPRSSEELAAATDAHPRSLYRLLRALAAAGVFREESGRRFGLTPLGECLRTDAAVSLAGWAVFFGRAPYWRAWGDLLHSVRTGENAFRHAHGVDVWEYRSQEPEERELFDGAMTALSRVEIRDILDAYDFGRFPTVVDIAGGRGALLAAVLAAYPDLEGVLFDQPNVVAGAEDLLVAAGVLDRCRIVGGDFFEAVPEGGDAYLLKSIVHDWEDEEATAILRNCRRVVPESGALLVIERDLGSPNEAPRAKFMDLNMLVAPGGRERTIDEYAALFESAGFRLSRTEPTRGGFSIIEGSPA